MRPDAEVCANCGVVLKPGDGRYLIDSQVVCVPCRDIVMPRPQGA